MDKYLLLFVFHVNFNVSVDLDICRKIMFRLKLLQSSLKFITLTDLFGFTADARCHFNSCTGSSLRDCKIVTMCHC